MCETRCLAVRRLEIIDLNRPPEDIYAVMGRDMFHGAVVLGPTRAVTRRPRAGDAALGRHGDRTQVAHVVRCN
jgi:hypothetical protein